MADHRPRWALGSSQVPARAAPWGAEATAKAERRRRRQAWVAGRPRAAGLLALSLVGLLCLYAGALVFLRPAASGAPLDYGQLVRDANCGAQPHAGSAVQHCRVGIAQATLLSQDDRLVGTLVTPTGPPQRFSTALPSADNTSLLQALAAGGTRLAVDAQEAKALVRFLAQFLLPLVILADLFTLLFFLVQAGGGQAAELVRFGTLGSRRPDREAQPTTFADVAAAEEAVIELAEVRDYLGDPGAYAAMGATPPKGVLLVGPPGCGKTLLARAVAGETKASFFSIAGSEFVEVLVGVGAARVRDLFAQARSAAPAIIFIDELDGVGRRRGAGLGQGHDEREQTLNELLTQMDGFSPAQGLVVLAATNRPDILDPAILRSGRFDRQVTVDRPDLEGRLAILSLHARGRRLAGAEADLGAVARATPGFTGADLANLMNEAALLAVRERAPVINRAHLEEAAERIVAGPRRRGRLLSMEERRTVAYHEAGHALMAAELGRARAVRKVSIVARGRGIGHLATVTETENGSVRRRSAIEANIALALGGLAAEELVFGEPSTGAEADLERATAWARDMAGRFGMSEALGPVRILHEDREVFLGRDYLASGDVSQPTLEQLDAEVRRILDGCRRAAAGVLMGHRRALDAMAAALVEQETLEGADLEATLAGIGPRPRLPTRPA